MSAPRPPHVVVAGGGIAGLAAAHRIVELARERGRPVRLTLLEAGARLGGSIASTRVDGFLVEGGPDSFLSEKPWALRLCERIGLTPRLVRTNEAFRRTFVVHGGRLHPLPEGFLLLAPTRLWPMVTSRLFSWRGKLRMALDLVLPRGAAAADESLGAFVTRRLGREALERVAQPLVGGIYAADPDRLSLAATMPRFLEMERTRRSLIWALWRQARQAAAGASGARWSLFVSLDDGMQVLVDALAARLPPGSVRLQAALAALEPGPSWRATLADGAVMEADAVILATPAYRTAPVVAGVDRTLADELEAIPYASSATVTLAYRRGQIAGPLDGFGFVVPLVEARTVVACTFSSVKYPGRAPAGHVLLRAFTGGRGQEALLAQDDAALAAAVRAELDALLRITGPPLLERVHRYPQAMPQYHVGHLDRLARIEARLAPHRGLALAGNAYRGVGVPDCIRTGESAAERVWEALRPG